MKKPIIFKIVPIFFGIVFLLSLLYWGIIGYVAFKVASNPNKTAKEMGGIVKSFKEGMEDTVTINKP